MLGKMSRLGNGRAVTAFSAGVASALVLAACSSAPDQTETVTEIAGASSLAATAGAGSSLEDRGWSLVWSDEFDGTDLDRSKWTPEVSCWGGGNQERQCYTDRPENVRVADGSLHLVARKEDWTGPLMPPEFEAATGTQRTQPYTSGKVRSRDLADWTYGRFSARLKLPKGQGTWSAFWMMPADDAYGGWPLSGEIDIMEAVNLGGACDECAHETVETNTQGALHFGDLPPGNTYIVGETALPAGANPGDGFHVYTVEWGEGTIQWLVDDVVFMRADTDDWYSGAPSAEGNPLAPFDQSFFLALNLAVGGHLSEDFNGKGIDETIFPVAVEADWVRVYQCTPDRQTGRACMQAKPED